MAVIPWESELATILGSQIRSYNSNAQPNTGKCIALYGKPGTGKSDLATSLADCKYATPILYLNAEGGAWSFAHRSDIEIIDINAWSDFSTLLSKLYAVKSLPFRTLIIDNMSELQALNVLAIVGTRGTAGINGTSMPSQQNWGASTSQLLNATRLLHDLSRRLNINVVFVAWEDARKDSVTNQIVKSGIGFTPALARSFPGIVDIVFHLTVQNDSPYYTRILNAAANPHSDAKFRRNKSEEAQSIPLTIAYRDQQPFVDIFNTLLGGERWPVAKYASLANKARVDYATTASADDTQGTVESIVVTKLASDTTT